MPLSAVIVDDEQLARDELAYLLKNAGEVNVVAQGKNGLEAVSLIKEHNPDLVFLDVQMPGLDGFGVIKKLLDKKVPLPKIVFATAFDQYAVKAFEVNAVDYLLKPFSYERLKSAIQRAREQFRAKEESAAQLNGSQRPAHLYTNRIIFKSRGRILFLPVSDIRWIGAEGNYVRLCTGTENHLLRETMAHLEQRLDPRGFLRVHRSFIVNLKYVKEVRRQTNGDSVVILDNGEQVAMGRSYRTALREHLHQG